ncbi:MAG: sigma-54 dependent transcriptional regulator [Desulfobacterales bacterium]|jgi:DNA-binding NtrC family response regulator|nr:sigma-54 dependent transcriptional regulator [Desulfobacteraceae bacterium]MDD3991469.1 sigma-54 dependent transcriptional regulator [Desulfobacteraceae bacterium]MDY0312437.1 sigma-54 dependent transcriptional regulator [Desulfobacterales bacterium]
MKRTILVVDDEQDMRELLQRSLEPDLNCKVVTAGTGEEALKKLSGNPFDLVLADIRMPGMDGLELLELIKSQHPQQTVVMMTAYGGVDTAVTAMRHGAYDFIIKPFEYDALLVRLEKALERALLIRENQQLRMDCGQRDGLQDLVGNSAMMKRVYETIRTVAQTELTVLITGASGVGKDLSAQAIHRLSPRRNGPFVAVNCPTVPEQILESELFGYRKGAFTHATQNKIGLFQEASQGTIFLDEIGDISPPIQAKLLRVLQEKEIKPLGDTRTISVDVRIVASTNQDLAAKIACGEFREDLFHRLNVLPVRLPSLHEHVEDIPLIAGHLLRKHCTALDRPLKRLSPDLMDIFKKHAWTGNVREMENLIIQGILFSAGAEIQPADVGLAGIQEAVPGIPAEMDAGLFTLTYKEAKAKVLEAFNSRYIGRRLTDTGGNVTQAARDCGLERQALQQIMRRYDISADSYRQ